MEKLSENIPALALFRLQKQVCDVRHWSGAITLDFHYRLFARNPRTNPGQLGPRDCFLEKGGVP